MPYKFLIVDNAAYARQLLRTMLESHGHAVVGEAEDTKQALELYRSLKPDLVTVDMMLHGESGLDTVRALIRLDAGARMIIVTAMADETASTRAMDYGAKACVTKSEGWPALEQAIARAFAENKR